MQKNIGCIHLFQSQLGLCNVNCEWNRLCSQTVGIGHSNVAIKKFSYVLLSLSPCVLIQKYVHVASALSTVSASMVLASALASASTFWPRLTSLYIIDVISENI